MCSRPELSNRGLFPCLHSLISTQEGLGEFETVMQTRDAVKGLHNFWEFSQLPMCLVKFCCSGIIAQAADPDCEVVAGNSNRNSRLLCWECLRENTFYTNLTAKTRQPAVQSLIWNIYSL